jgi:preprotein translocase subunit YajC
MSKVQLTQNEIESLKNLIEESENYGKTKLRNIILILTIATFGAGILLVTINEMSSTQIFLPLFGLLILWILMMIGAWKLSQGNIKKLKKDLKSGFKIIGISRIRSINKLNRKIKLEDGIFVWETNPLLDQLKVGDKIEYSVSPSNEHIFNIIKTPHNN